MIVLFHVPECQRDERPGLVVLFFYSLLFSNVFVFVLSYHKSICKSDVRCIGGGKERPCKYELYHAPSSSFSWSQ